MKASKPSAKSKLQPSGPRVSGAAPKSPVGRAAAGTVNVWEDDPGTGVITSTPIPDVAKQPLAYRFPDPAPAPSDDSTSPAFLYWTAAAALRRGADFWAPKVPTGQWQLGPVLPVLLDEGVDLNAYYDRQALNFFHGPSPNGTAYSGASPDVVCHEMGHAILDSLKPQLWDAANQESSAFHESFGDMSAILSALQQQSLRTAVLADTAGHLYRSSRLSRLAEELGAAIRAQQPDAVDPDCLRNAVNSFTYADPSTLPSSAPASQLSSEVHSFSRVFTGAFFECLAGMLANHAADSAKPTANELLDVSLQMRDILVAGVRNAAVVSNFFAEVAAAMVQASSSTNPAYPAIFNGAFVRRAILSLQTAANIRQLQASAAASASVAGLADTLAAAPLDRVALPTAHYGLSEPLLVQTPSHPRRVATMAGSGPARQAEPLSAVSAASHFVDSLFANGHVDYNKFGIEGMALTGGRKVKTHRIVRGKDGALSLSRLLFDCGFCRC